MNLIVISINGDELVKKSFQKKGKDHWHWRGGKSKTTNGYIEIWTNPDDPFYSMAGKEGYIYEHRLVMARNIGRCLNSNEEVHHINGNKHDNRIENLILKSKKGHMKEHYDEIHKLRKEVHRLRAKLREANIT